MSSPTAHRAATDLPARDRPDPYQLVTDAIIAHLERGVVPWRCPWNREVGQPRNFHTGLPYRGANVMLLGCRFADSPWWMTYRQAFARGGHVRKGERGAMVVKFGTVEKRTEAASPSSEAPSIPKPRRFLRTFTVFNAAQIEGIAFPAPPSEPEWSQEERHARAEQLVAGMATPPAIRFGSGARACYRPHADEIEMPPRALFDSLDAYFQTLFHELGHATGHPNRLNRETLNKHDEFGGLVYSQEELVAEMCAAFVGMEAGIVHDRHEQSASYLDAWLSVLKVRDHRRWIVQAASQATKAADFILNRSQQAAPPDAP